MTSLGDRPQKRGGHAYVTSTASLATRIGDCQEQLDAARQACGAGSRESVEFRIVNHWSIMPD